LEWLATDAVEDSAADRWARPAISGDSLAMLQYTSGSTGTPKGVLLSHTNMLANAECVFSAFEFTPDDRILSWLPTFHDMGFMSGVLQPLYSGCPVVGLPPTSFLEKPYRWLAAIHASRITVSGGPNFAYDLCVRKTTPEQRAALDLSCWKLAYNGAETVRLETIDRFAQAFAPSGFQRRAMFPCFGLAEATLIVSGAGRAAEPVSLRVDKAGLEAGEVRVGEGATFVASGRTVQGATVAIVDPETRHRAPADRIGEIWVAGPSVGRGYWQRVEDTEAVFGARLADDPARTYVRTGDLGFQRDGELFICGRVKDLIIIRGANHYPQDIELTVERAHAAIRPGCVAAFAMEIADEERVVIVAEVDRRYHGRDRRRLDRGDRRAADPGQKNPDAEALDVDQLFWIVRDAIAERHELEPHDIVLVRAGSIHKTSSGKLQRGACRQAFRAGELEVLAEWRADGTKRHSDVPSTDRKPEVDRPVRSRATTTQPAMPRTTTGEIPKRPVVGIESLRKPAVVVVDADPARRDIVLRTLADARFTVVSAETADSALQLVSGSTFATAISDDLALLSQIAATSSHTARLLVTGFDDPQAVRDALASRTVTSVLSHKAGPQQIHAAVSEAVEEWVVHHTDLAIRGIETFLSSWLANRLQINRQAVDLDAQVAGYGLDSLSIVEVQAALSDWIGYPVPETLIRGKASIRSVARRLASAGEVSLAPAAAREDVAVAIVGMGCSVPGARDVDALWHLIHDNVDAITVAPADRQTNARWGGFVDGVQDFDAAFFGLA
ncbi:MAG TPA: AMP-binding protein, partial [Kofleriaceae bacterium]|nr:AMP-binding protein [Kofleriaceae bacterium]